MQTYSLDPGVLIAFLLLTARMMAMMQFAPPFSSGAIPIRVRLAVSVGVGIALAPVLTPSVEPTTAALVGAVIYQAVAGAAMGALIALFMATLQAAGSMIDVLSGIGVAVLYDPTTQVQAGPIGRLHQIIMVTGMFVVDGHLLLVRGVLRSFEAAPLTGLRIDRLPDAFLQAAGDLMLAAVEISLPVLVAMAMAEATLALATRAAPKLNVMVIGFAVKSLVMMVVLTVSLPLAVRAVSVLVERSVTWSIALLGG